MPSRSPAKRPSRLTPRAGAARELDGSAPSLTAGRRRHSRDMTADGPLAREGRDYRDSPPPLSPRSDHDDVTPTMPNIFAAGDAHRDGRERALLDIYRPLVYAAFSLLEFRDAARRPSPSRYSRLDELHCAMHVRAPAFHIGLILAMWRISFRDGDARCSNSFTQDSPLMPKRHLRAFDARSRLYRGFQRSYDCVALLRASF